MCPNTRENSEQHVHGWDELEVSAERCVLN